MLYRLGLSVLCSIYRQDYETLFHVVILSKHHHHQITKKLYLFVINSYYSFMMMIKLRIQKIYENININQIKC
jgi:hypothetical protein